MKRSMRWAAATVAATGLLLTGGGTALADESTSATPSEGVLCTKRIPAVLARIDRVTARINGDAETRGSTAWLEAKVKKARDAGFDATADLLDARVEARPERLDQLAELRSDVEDAQAEDCTP
jgi:hypothetical protein